MKILTKLLPLLLIIIVSCDKDEDPTGPTPVPSFTQDRSFIEAGETVTFTNTSTDAATYLWDFGDGGTSTSESPAYAYTETGTYDVVLTATGSGGISQTVSGSVLVGKRYTSFLVISSINFENANMESWDDDDSGPDVLFGFAKSADESILLYDLGEDFLEENLPIGTEISLEDQIELTDEPWIFIFIDNDEPLDQLSLENQDDVMYINELNPTEVGEKDYETGDGFFTVTEAGFEFTIGFQIR